MEDCFPEWINLDIMMGTVEGSISLNDRGYEMDIKYDTMYNPLGKCFNLSWHSRLSPTKVVVVVIIYF